MRGADNEGRITDNGGRITEGGGQISEGGERYILFSLCEARQQTLKLLLNNSAMFGMFSLRDHYHENKFQYIHVASCFFVERSAHVCDVGCILHGKPTSQT